MDSLTFAAHLDACDDDGVAKLAHTCVVDEFSSGDPTLDEVVEASRAELGESAIQRKTDAIIKAAIGKGTMPSADDVEEELGRRVGGYYDGTDHVSDAEEDIVLGYLLEPDVPEESDSATLAAVAPMPPSSVEHPIDKPNVFAKKSQDWNRSFDEAMAAFSQLALQRKCAIGGANQEMSLVDECATHVSEDGGSNVDHHIVFVNWKAGSQARLGQEVRDDSDGFIISPMALHYPYRDFGSAKILSPSVGARVKKASKDVGRASFPAAALQLRNMFVTLYDDNTFALCTACGQANLKKYVVGDTGGESEHDLVAGKVARCAVCLMGFHKSCARRFLQRCLDADSIKTRAAVTIPGEFAFSSAICPLCAEGTRQLSLEPFQPADTDKARQTNIQTGLTTYRDTTNT
jgi:hypothetical protein